MRIRKLFVIAALVHMAPVAAWAAFKPIRVLAPGVLGLHCTANGVCVDDLSRLDEATSLKTEAVSFVNLNIGRIDSAPRAIFCSKQECSKAFGFTSNVAYNVGTSGFVVSPRGWQPHLVRHELIHHLQNERLGTLNAWLFKPNWFLEGMAYSLSQDPRRPMPEPMEGWRSQYDQWANGIGSMSIWQAAQHVK